MNLELIQSLNKKAETKVVMLVMDGLGGLPGKDNGLTELEAADTPNLDQLAAKSICGLHQPVGPGITPGSGPSHLGLFGYDPLKYEVGRGVLAALGVGFDLHHDDVAARGNFCTVDDNGIVIDRRAGRIETDLNRKLCDKLKQIKLSGAEFFIQPVKEYRFLFVLRGKNLSGELIDTDPQSVGLKPVGLESRTKNDAVTVKLVNEFIEKAQKILADEHPANMVLLRGFSKKPKWPNFPEVFGMRAAAIAAYPMYKGVSRLVGMEVLETGDHLEDEFTTLERNWDKYDFFYVHVKKTDSSGEDGDYDRKKKIIEAVDKLVPRMMKLKPDVVMVTGDHSTPSSLKAHGWQPVPVMIYSQFCRPDNVERFGERACIPGGLGANIPAVNLMPIVVANAGRLEKFGA